MIEGCFPETQLGGCSFQSTNGYVYGENNCFLIYDEVILLLFLVSITAVEMTEGQLLHTCEAGMY